MIGKSVDAAKAIAGNYLNMVSNKPYDPEVDLEEAAVYAGVRQFPARIKCASISWQAFLRTLEEKK